MVPMRTFWGMGFRIIDRADGGEPPHARLLPWYGLGMWKKLLGALLVAWIGGAAWGGEVTAEEMKRVYEEVRTPFKYGVVVRPGEGKKVDCPSVFRFGGKWWMTYIQF